MIFNKNKPEIISLDHGFKAYECEIFYEKTKDFVNYKPCSMFKKSIDDKLGSIIHLVVIDATIWTKFVAYWKKRMINLSYGFYDPIRNEIFINIDMCGIKANKNCTVLSSITSKQLIKLSQIISHELTHYNFQNNLSKVISLTQNKLKHFYKTYWMNVVTPEIYNQLYNTHFLLTVNLNKNAIDPIYGKIATNQMNRFISILENIENYYPNKILNKKLFEDTIDTIKVILEGNMVTHKSVQERIILGYKSIVNSYPKGLSLGQELIFASEILSVCSNMPNSSEAVQLVSKVNRL